MEEVYQSHCHNYYWVTSVYFNYFLFLHSPNKWRINHILYVYVS